MKKQEAILERLGESEMKNHSSRLFRHFNKSNIAESLLISFLFALIFGLMNPLEIMLDNWRDFFVTCSEVLSCLWLPAFCMFVGLFLVLMISLMIHKSVFVILKSVLLGLTAASYCQELFLNGKMIVGDNDTIIGEISDVELSVNFLIHFAIIAFFIILSVKQFMPVQKAAPSGTDQPDPKTAGSFLKKHIIVYALASITIMKMIGLGSSYSVIANKDLRSLDKWASDHESFFSYTPTTSFSKDQENIYVFIVDTFDTLWCDELLELYPEIKDELEGFTFYQNNTALYGDTFPSVCNMLTSVPYDFSGYEKYFDRAWKSENTYSILKENDYQVNLVMDKQYTYGSDSLLEPFCDNFELPKNMTRTVNEKMLRKMLYCLSLTKITPYFFKYMIPNVLNAVSNALYLNISFEGPENTTSGLVNTSSDRHLYEYARSAEFHADCDQNVFTLIHLDGAHNINEPFVEETGFNKGSTLQRTIRANFETILLYIRSAKKLGVYDHTTFVILGDHGDRSEAVRDKKFHLFKPTLPALIIKPANAEHIPFQYDRYTGLSNDMFMASILEYAGIDHQKYGHSYQDIIKSQEIVPREFNWKMLNRAGEKFIITGDARDFSNWERTE